MRRGSDCASSPFLRGHDFIFDPLHYLALIEQKINALDPAAPLDGWRLPEEFMRLRRLLEARMGKQGKREFVQVLRLMEVFRRSIGSELRLVQLDEVLGLPVRA